MSILKSSDSVIVSCLVDGYQRPAYPIPVPWKLQVLNKGSESHFINCHLMLPIVVQPAGSKMSDIRLLEQFLIKGKNVVITGGARGLGLNFAHGLAQAGANIAAIDVSDKPGGGFDTLSRYGGTYKYYTADVRDYQGLKKVIDQISQDFGSIDGWYVWKSMCRPGSHMKHSGGRHHPGHPFSGASTGRF